MAVRYVVTRTMDSQGISFSFYCTTISFVLVAFRGINTDIFCQNPSILDLPEVKRSCTCVVRLDDIKYGTLTVVSYLRHVLFAYLAFRATEPTS